MYRIGIIGTGNPARSDGRSTTAMAYEHGRGYRQLADRCHVVAACDIVEENARLFCEEFGVPRLYLDHREMLAKEDLDLVSVCTWPHLHEPMVVDCAQAGVRAIHCEKPMAATWGGAKRMVAACREAGVQLTFNHMRRFGRPAREARRLVEEGAIGQLQRLEFGFFNLCDYGSHQFDLTNYFNGQARVEWVLAQIDYRTEDVYFGQHQENQAVAVWQYENGVHGLTCTGRPSPIGAHNRLIGTEGIIEIDPTDQGLSRIWRMGGKWEPLDHGGETVHGPGNNGRAIAHVVECLESGAEPEIGAGNALQATELFFAAWESSRRRGRVDLPLDVEDNPLVAMVESGELKPRPAAPTD